MRGCEIKELRWRDVDMIGRSLTVRKSKTEAGERVIPLERRRLGGHSGALQALTGAWRLRAEPFPLSLPARRPTSTLRHAPLKSWRTAWRRLTRAIQCPGCGLLQNPGETCSGCEADTSEAQESLRRIPLPRSTASGHHRTCRVQGERPDHHVDCRARLEEDAPALLPRPAGREAERAGRARR